MGYLRFVVRHPWVVIVLITVTSVAVSPWALQVGFENSAEMWLMKDDPAVIAYEDYRDEFASDDFVFVAWGHPDGALSTANLTMTARLVERMEKLDKVLKVTALTNMEEIHGEGDLLEVRPLLTPPLSEADQRTVLRRLVNDPLYEGTIISPDGRSTTMAIKISGSDEDLSVRAETTRSIEEVLTAESGVRFHMAGMTAFDSAFWDIFQRDFRVLMVIQFVVFFTILGLLFRSVVGVLLPSLTVGTAVLWTVAAMGYLGITANMCTPMLAVVILAVGVADAVHMISEYQEDLARGLGKEEALVASGHSVFVPCLFTTLTTALGFLGLLLIKVPPLRDFGVFSALGAIIALVVSYSLVPAVLSLLPAPAVTISADVRSGVGRSRLLNASFRLVVRHRYGLAVVSLLLFIAGLAGLPHVRATANWYQYLGRDHPLIEATDFVEDNIGGVLSVEMLVRPRAGQAVGPEAMKDPESLAELASLQKRMDNVGAVQSSLSPADYISEMNRAMHGGDTTYRRVPLSREEIAQYLLMYEMDAPDGDLYEFVSYDFSRARLSVRTKMSERGSHDAVVRAAREQAAGLSKLEAVATGMSVLYSDMEDHMIRGMVRGFTASFVMVAIVMVLLLGSFRYGLLGLVPGVLPLGVVLGMTGWLRIDIGTMPIMMGNVALGVAVDNAIHLLVRYRRHRAAGILPAEAIQRAVTVVGRPVLFTAVVLCCGFAVLGFSEMVTARHFGVMTSLTLLGSLIAAVVTVPAVILILDERFRGRAPEMVSAGDN